jgi:iron uptake system EfeUOB component EfeO/EfeM
MAKKERFSMEQAREIGTAIGIDWKNVRFSLWQFWRGLHVELEHGREDARTNVTNDDSHTTGRIAWAHLNEIPDYYTRLDEMEKKAEAFWDGRKQKTPKHVKTASAKKAALKKAGKTKKAGKKKKARLGMAKPHHKKKHEKR